MQHIYINVAIAPHPYLKNSIKRHSFGYKCQVFLPTEFAKLNRIFPRVQGRLKGCVSWSCCPGQGFSFDGGGEPQVTSAIDGLDE